MTHRALAEAGMAMANKPYFRADQVGSLLRPPALLAARQRFAQGLIDSASLRQQEDAAIADVVRQQEDCGLEIVVDGAFRRENGWIDFVRGLSGVEIREGKASQAFVAPVDHDSPDCGHDHGHDHAHGDAADEGWKYVPKNVVTVGRLARASPNPGPISAPDYRFLHSVTQRSAKVTLPSPTRLHFHGGRDTVSRSAYPDEEQFFADIARIYQDEIIALEAEGCRYIQIDDPMLTYFISDRLRDEVRQAGDDPDARLARYVALTNACIAKRRPDTTVGIHVCRGNSRSGWISEGGYERIAEAVLGGLQCDQLLLEYDDERSGDFQPLRHVPADRRVVLGLVTTKRGALENADTLRRRIDEASEFVDLDRLAISPQCGFASTVEGNLITQEHQWAKLRLVVEVARQVWGTAGSF